MKRLFALFLAFVFLMAALPVLAEDEFFEFDDDESGFEDFGDEEFEDFGGEEEFEDDFDAPPVQDMSTDQRQSMTSHLESLSGYQGDDVLDDKSLHIMYMPLERIPDIDDSVGILMPYNFVKKSLIFKAAFRDRDLPFLRKQPP